MILLLLEPNQTDGGGGVFALFSHSHIPGEEM